MFRHRQFHWQRGKEESEYEEFEVCNGIMRGCRSDSGDFADVQSTSLCCRKLLPYRGGILFGYRHYSHEKAKEMISNKAEKSGGGEKGSSAAFFLKHLLRRAHDMLRVALYAPRHVRVHRANARRRGRHAERKPGCESEKLHISRLLVFCLRRFNPMYL